jgi:hypothetical protein
MTYFYPASRAHHAYVMSIDFGMKFRKKSGLWTPEGLLTVTGAGGYKIEIAEESLGLLEPRVGDLVSFVDGHAAKVGNLSKRHPETFQVYGGTMTFDTKASRIKTIIQRDGKPFQMPEQEKAEGV